MPEKERVVLGKGRVPEKGWDLWETASLMKKLAWGREGCLKKGGVLEVGWGHSERERYAE